VKSIIFKTFDLNQQQYTDLLEALKAFCYDANNGEGVQVFEENSDFAKYVYYYETTYSQNSYNPSTGEFEKIDSKKIELVPFIIDLKFKTLDILGSKQKCSRIIEMMGKLTKYKIPISDIQVNPIKILMACSSKGIPYQVTRVKISDYVFFDNIVGNCVLNLSDYGKTEELLKKYEQQIVNFSAILTLDDSYSITFLEVALFHSTKTLNLWILSCYAH